MRFTSLFALGSCCVLSVPAMATGNLGCEVDDATMSLNIESSISTGLGEPMLNFRGEASLKDGSISEPLRNPKFDRTHLTQYWLGGPDLRLRLYQDIDGEISQGSVELIIKTESSDEEGGFAGRYTLMVYDTAGRKPGDAKESRFEGKVSCFAG